jgi:hypothetical protein
MKKAVLAIVLLVGSSLAFANEGVYMPWEEFKSFYRQIVEREFQTQAIPAEKPRLVYSLDQAHYSLTVSDDESVTGEAALSGTIVSGEPELVQLLGRDTVIAGVSNLTGGTLLCASQDSGICFLPEPAAKKFQLTVSFLMKPKDENGIRVLSYAIPAALQNSLTLKLPPGSKLIESPGILGADGVYHFGISPALTVRYAGKTAALQPDVIEIDALSRVHIQKNLLLIDTLLIPTRPLPSSLTLLAPQGAKLTGASLKTERPNDAGDRYQVSVPASFDGPFSVSFILDTPPDQADISFTLPEIEGNTEQHTQFLVYDPDDGQVSVSANGLVSRLPTSALKDALRQDLAGDPYFMIVPTGERITLAVRRFQAVSAPPTILDSQFLYTSFDENGTMLSVLILDAPPELGSRLALKAVPESELWSLTVNGEKKSLYAGGDGTWVIPLVAGQPSHVELAVLRKGPKLGLQGQVEVIMPGSGLPSKSLGICLALPQRVDLLSLEGPVKPAKPDEFKPPAEFAGKPYYFSQSFYKGEGMRLALTYKEPVKINQ